MNYTFPEDPPWTDAGEEIMAATETHPASLPERWTRLVNEVAHDMLVKAANMPEGLRTWVSAFNLACADTLGYFLFATDFPEGGVPVNVDRMTVEDMRHVHATLYLALVGNFVRVMSQEQWLAMMTMPEVVYNQPKATISRWVDFINENNNDEHFSGRLVYRINDEINPALGVEKNNPLTAMMWGQILGAITQTTNQLRQSERFIAGTNTDIDNAVRAERGKQPGCGAALITIGLVSLWMAAKAFAF